MSIGPLGTNFGQILIKMQIFSFTKMHLKISSVKWRLVCGDESNWADPIIDTSHTQTPPPHPLHTHAYTVAHIQYYWSNLMICYHRYEIRVPLRISQHLLIYRQWYKINKYSMKFISKFKILDEENPTILLLNLKGNMQYKTKAIDD